MRSTQMFLRQPSLLCRLGFYPTLQTSAMKRLAIVFARTICTPVRPKTETTLSLLRSMLGSRLGTILMTIDRAPSLKRSDREFD